MTLKRRIILSIIYLYIYINSFSGSERIYEIIDQIIEEFQELGSMVVDVRGNGGGSSTNGETIATRFADRKRLFRYLQYRNGPAHSDFTDLIPEHIEQAGERRFTKPVGLIDYRDGYNIRLTKRFLKEWVLLPIFLFG